MSAKKRLLSLVFLFLLLGGIYWGLGNTPLTLPVTYLYYALCLLLSLLYLLVSGGIEPFRQKGRAETKEESPRHPAKRLDQFRLAARKTEEKAPPEQGERPNPLRLSQETREKWSIRLLILTIPFYLIFLLDFLYLRFFI